MAPVFRCRGTRKHGVLVLCGSPWSKDRHIDLELRNNNDHNYGRSHLVLSHTQSFPYLTSLPDHPACRRNHNYGNDYHNNIHVSRHHLHHRHLLRRGWLCRDHLLDRWHRRELGPAMSQHLCRRHELSCLPVRLQWRNILQYLLRVARGCLSIRR